METVKGNWGKFVNTQILISNNKPIFFIVSIKRYFHVLADIQFLVRKTSQGHEAWCVSTSIIDSILFRN